MGLTEEERRIIVQLEIEKAQSIMAQIETTTKLNTPKNRYKKG